MSKRQSHSAVSGGYDSPDEYQLVSSSSSSSSRLPDSRDRAKQKKPKPACELSQVKRGRCLTDDEWDRMSFLEQDRRSERSEKAESDNCIRGQQLRKWREEHDVNDLDALNPKPCEKKLMTLEAAHALKTYAELYLFSPYQDEYILLHRANKRSFEWLQVKMSQYKIIIVNGECEFDELSEKVGPSTAQIEDRHELILQRKLVASCQPIGKVQLGQLEENAQLKRLKFQVQMHASYVQSCENAKPGVDGVYRKDRLSADRRWIPYVVDDQEAAAQNFENAQNSVFDSASEIVDTEDRLDEARREQDHWDPYMKGQVVTLLAQSDLHYDRLKIKGQYIADANPHVVVQLRHAPGSESYDCLFEAAPLRFVSDVMFEQKQKEAAKEERRRVRDEEMQEREAKEEQYRLRELAEAPQRALEAAEALRKHQAEFAASEIQRAKDSAEWDARRLILAERASKKAKKERVDYELALAVGKTLQQYRADLKQAEADGIAQRKAAKASR